MGKVLANGRISTIKRQLSKPFGEQSVKTNLKIRGNSLLLFHRGAKSPFRRRARGSCGESSDRQRIREPQVIYSLPSLDAIAKVLRAQDRMD